MATYRCIRWKPLRKNNYVKWHLLSKDPTKTECGKRTAIPWKLHVMTANEIEECDTSNEFCRTCLLYTGPGDFLVLK